jgi:transposase
VGNKAVMTNDGNLKATMREASSLADAGASEGARRATGDAPASAAKILPAGASVEVIAGSRRRSFSLADKQRILEAADRCAAPGEVGALLRREGVYSSSLSTWRKQRDAAELAALAPHKRGPKPAPDRDQMLQIAQLRRDNERLQSRLDKALFVIEVQKKVAALLGQPIDPSAALRTGDDSEST